MLTDEEIIKNREKHYDPATSILPVGVSSLERITADAAYKKGQEDERERIAAHGRVTFGVAPLKIKFFSIPWSIWQSLLRGEMPK